jgi:hypothetical protein
MILGEESNLDDINKNYDQTQTNSKMDFTTDEQGVKMNLGNLKELETALSSLICEVGV